MLSETAPVHENVDKKQFILGRTQKSLDGLLSIGRFHALDRSLGAPVFLDVLRPHMGLICGKRGYGKSYTLGVILEEIAKQKPKIRDNISAILIDTLGIFWSLSIPNSRQQDVLKQWNLSSQSFSIMNYTTRELNKKEDNQYYKNKKLWIKTSMLTPLHWCQLFNVNPIDPVGIILSKYILNLKQKSDYYTIKDIINEIENDKQTDYVLKTAVSNLFVTAESWNIFSKDGIDANELLITNRIHIIDLSGIENDYLKTIIIGILADNLFQLRVNARRIEELNDIGISSMKRSVPLVWLAIDEAQLFIPWEKNTFSKSVLRDKWMRLGRQPGLSLLLATQKPSLIDPEVFSHADIILCHRLTADEDIRSLKRIHPTYFPGDIQSLLGKIGSDKGVALVVDDTQESVHIIKIRPRQSWHSGGEPLAASEMNEHDDN